MTAADDRAIGDGDASWHRGHAICSTSFVLGAEGVSTLAHFFEVSVGGCPRGSLFYRRFLRRSRTPSGRPSDAIPSRDTACSTSPWCEALSAAKWSWANGIYRIRAGQHKWPGPGRQIAELQAAGCAKIYREKVSGAKSDRQELGKLLRAIEPGDVLMVSRRDRLARSTRDLLNILDAVTQAGAGWAGGRKRGPHDEADRGHAIEGRSASITTDTTRGCVGGDSRVVPATIACFTPAWVELP